MVTVYSLSFELYFGHPGTLSLLANFSFSGSHLHVEVLCCDPYSPSNNTLLTHQGHIERLGHHRNSQEVGCVVTKSYWWRHSEATENLRAIWRGLLLSAVTCSEANNPNSENHNKRLAGGMFPSPDPHDIVWSKETSQRQRRLDNINAGWYLLRRHCLNSSHLLELLLTSEDQFHNWGRETSSSVLLFGLVMWHLYWSCSPYRRNMWNLVRLDFYPENTRILQLP